MKIFSIDAHSTGEEIGILPGDKLRTINGEKIRDILDFRFNISDEEVELEIEREGERFVIELSKEIDDSLGLNFEPIKVRMCGNDCPFCFVDQNPAGMRKTLYFRDEDFRLSFLAGHFVTLTNISNRDLERIVKQRLTPLYISIHAIDWEIRKFLLGLKKPDRLLEKLKYLTSNGIELHTQIVVCPGVNDGTVLEETVAALSEYYPGIGSVAMVPLGLTKHRESLTPLTPVTTEFAVNFLKHADEIAALYKKKLGKFFVYPSDEFYIRAKQPTPGLDRYDCFEQFENGVGMVRTFIEAFKAVKANLPARLDRETHITFVSGMMMGDLLKKHVVDAFNSIENLQVDLVKVANDFYGHTIMTTGLLTGQDIFKNLAKRNNGEKIYLPRNCINDDALFLDNWPLASLEQKLNTPVEVVTNNFQYILDDIQKLSLAA